MQHEWDEKTSFGNLARCPFGTTGGDGGALFVLWASVGVCVVSLLSVSRLDRIVLSQLRNASGNALSLERAMGDRLPLSTALDVALADSGVACRQSVLRTLAEDDCYPAV